MARTTEAAVIEIMGSPSTLTTANVTPYLTPATTMVTKYLADEITDDDLLELIERYLAAHFVSLVIEKETKSEGVGGGEITQSYGGQWGKGLEFTSYGQMAMILDTSRILQRVNAGKNATALFRTVTDIGQDRDYPNI